MDTNVCLSELLILYWLGINMSAQVSNLVFYAQSTITLYQGDIHVIITYLKKLHAKSKTDTMGRLFFFKPALKNG